MGYDTEKRIEQLARRQHGLVSRLQLMELGLTAGMIHRRVECGRLTRLYRGVYLVGPIVLPRTRFMAAALACGDAALVSHASAIGLWELLPRLQGSDDVDVSVTRGRNTHRPGIRVHRVGPLEPRERSQVDGIPVTAPARTLIDFAGLASARELEQAVSRAEREHLIARAELAALLENYRGRRGLVLLRTILGAADALPFTRSEAEERFLALIRAAGLPTPEVNVRIHGFEVDFFWRTHGLVVEVDGYRHHSSRLSFERDRRRAARLAAQGVHVLSVTWPQLVRESIATAVLIGQALTARQRL